MSTNTIKAILIDPFKDEIKEIDIPVDENKQFHFKDIYIILDCDMIEYVYLAKDRILMIDEEGLLKDEDHQQFFRITDKKAFRSVNGGLFAGKGLIVQQAEEFDTFKDFTLKDLDFDIINCYNINQI